MFMSYYQNNRRYERYNYESPVLIYPETNSGHYYYGRLHDYSKGGMYFNTDGDLKADEKYLIQMLDHDDSAAGPEKYEKYEGVIRWAEIPSKYYDKDNLYYFGYGVAYPEPVTY